MKQAVCIYIEKDGFVLGVARRDNHSDFGLPGGKVEDNETLKQAAKRELFEETGLVVKEEDLLNIFERSDAEYQCTTFLCQNWNSDIKNGDAGPVKFCTKDELIKGSFGNYNKILFDYLEDKIRSDIKYRYGKVINE